MSATPLDAAGVDSSRAVAVRQSRLRFLLPLAAGAWLVGVPVLMALGSQDAAGQRLRLLAAAVALLLSVGGFILALHLDSRAWGWTLVLLIVASLVVVGVVGTSVLTSAPLGEFGPQTGLACQRFAEGARVCPGS